MTNSTSLSAPLVSVVMSCYNGSRWLRESIESVLAQTLDDFEFILVDDGSTDESWNIIQTYSDKDERIVSISKKHTGLADSLNVGIKKASGAWIARLDVDDICEPTRLEEQKQFVKTHPNVILLGTGYVEIDERGHRIKKNLYPRNHNKLVQHLRQLQRFFPHSSAFFKREIAEFSGLYNPIFKKSQDWELWLRLAELGEIACLNNCLVRIRTHSEQISNSISDISQPVYSTAATICYYLRTHSFPDPSSKNDDSTWQTFLLWVKKRMIEEELFERRKVWLDARTQYFAAQNRFVSSIYFARSFLRSRHAFILLWEKIIGSSIPKRLAIEWMKIS